jgi:hypothetical protein
MSFVGIRHLPSEEELQKLLDNRNDKSCCYFLRWTHAVSGIIRELKDLPGKFPSPEGQMFNSDWELRWKRNKKGYEVLLLSTTKEDGFTAIKNERNKEVKWQTEIRTAPVYSNSETRFPKSFIYPKNENGKAIGIAQRYFIDTATGAIQFVVLTLKQPKSDKQP